MKTSSYQKRASENYRKRRRKEGWKFFNVFVSAEVHEKLKQFYQFLKG